MVTHVTVRHNFETAHRLPQLEGKCQSLHGHSWWVEITVAGEPHDGVVVDFGNLKAALRSWVDTYLDHGSMLGAHDRLVHGLKAEGCKVFVFDGISPLTHRLDWPTVENVAELLRRVTERELTRHDTGLNVARVRVTEAATNAAEVCA